ncbi:hypothetical protein Cgig2_004938 [Carnegiea gigantea]|uniref:DUF4283 domain-containing protein n=1 Tax=Carnegiea gigantea TaxID=171969 RepID=A0A9Q1KZG1_9CARY|nr:hypothetical protein Cgig2_004938 [Carnegiea gigantea]
MAMECGLEDVWRNLKLIEDEDVVISLCLYGNLMTEKSFNARAVKTVLQNIWKPKKGVVIRDLGENLFAFLFFLAADKDTVLNDGPWAFDGWFPLLKEIDGSKILSKVQFTTGCFRVETYDLPGNKKTIAFAQCLRYKLGAFVGCDESTIYGVDKSLCCRVDVDVAKPLRWGVMVKGLNPQRGLKSIRGVMRASPLKSHNKFAAAKMKDEKKLYLTFRNSRQSSVVHTTCPSTMRVVRPPSGYSKRLGKVDVQLLSYSLHHIDTTIRLEGEEVVWRFTRVYGWPESHLKWKTKVLIADLKPQSEVPALIGGDLNGIFYHGEKLGGPLKPQVVIDNFRDSIVDYGLYDLGYLGYDFTACNFHENGIVVEECLDRSCADMEWSLIFPGAIISHIDCDLSNHLPILLKCRPNAAGQKLGQFHFKNMWLSEPFCLEVVS